MGKHELKHRNRIAWSVKELSDIAGVGRDLIYAEINSGRLKSVKIKNRRLIRPKSAEEWLAKLEATTQEAMGFKEAVQ